MMASKFLVLSTTLLVACSSADPEGPPAANSTGGAGGAGGADGAGGDPSAACLSTFDADTVHLAAGADLKPGQETTVCVRWTTPDALDISGFQGALGPYGHHSLLLARPAGSEPDGISPCSEAEIMDAQKVGAFQMLAGVSYETDGKRYDFPSAPVQVGLRVDAGTQLVFDAHFLNPSEAPGEACASLDLSRGKPVIAQLLFRTVLPAEQYALTVPAHGSIDVTYEEPGSGHYRIAAASSHMHAGGKHMRLSIKETDTTVYETTVWSDPAPATFEAQKLIIEEGQTFRLECSFENNGPTDQHFPAQMCVGGMYLLPCTFPGAC